MSEDVIKAKSLEKEDQRLEETPRHNAEILRNGALYLQRERERVHLEVCIVT